MKKAVLKEIIHNVVAQKLLEAKKGTAAKYGYVISGKGTEDPVLQMNGFGNMPKSAWKKKIEKDVKDLLARVQAEDWSGAVYYLQQNGVLHSAINMMDEVLTDPKLREIDAGVSTNPSAMNVPLNTGTADDRIRQELIKNQEKLDDITNNIKKSDANISKRMETVNKANQKDELRKQQLTRQQGPIVNKIEQLKKKVESPTQ